MAHNDVCLTLRIVYLFLQKEKQLGIILGMVHLYLLFPKGFRKIFRCLGRDAFLSEIRSLPGNRKANSGTTQANNEIPQSS